MHTESTTSGGNILNDPESQWCDILAHHVPIDLPILIRPSGDILVVRNHENFIHITPQENDFLIVGPHGEIIPFIAQALRKKLFAQLNDLSVFHIDSHYDNHHRLFNKPENREITSEEISNLIQLFIDSQQGSEMEIFKRLIGYTNDDTVTFLHTLQRFFPKIGAAVKNRNTTTVIKLPPAEIYPDFDTQNAGDPLYKILEEARVGIYSIDADFVECRTETESEYKAKVMMDYLIQGMSAELEKASKGKDYPTIYTMSLDPIFCRNYMKVLISFLKGFYIPLIQTRTAEKTVKALQTTD